MNPMYSGLILMTVGAFFAGGGISFRKQKLPLVAQVIMWLIALALFGYGAYVAFTFGS
ncbi:MULTISPECIES: hypothetical protein [Rothia]|uniref:Uncharacterized protein n=2 Tax=Rothia aeria TaxID=172042 RepID=A0A2Z5QZ83_9MICC|nr:MULTISPECIES: hypothetical protein [Rothia]ERT67721.1 hypothetical protein HMPREF0742_00066 [Rothia aeria F0184]MDK7353365.1 hypothetical protein [Rothia aeria]MDK7678238.1 hypothetical protein [Rothia aeria]MDO4884921.1 hypothetical protein [Rothia sp. (in: high G+C Gram-positive bacteria)]QQT89584.1 hypothetical protein I6I94_02925 [Rothia aeria]